MKTTERFDGVITLKLSRRNLETLLAMLDASQQGSLISPDRRAIVIPEEDDVHYMGREAGLIYMNGEWR